MLDKNTFKKEMLHMSYTFPNWNVELENPDAMLAWYKHFQKMDDMNFKAMVSKYTQEERFSPTVAGLMQYREEGHYDSKSVDLGDMADEMYDDLLADHEGDKTL